MKVYINPRPQDYSEDGRGGGGIQRIVAAQARHLGAYGVEVVDSPDEADVIHIHAGGLVETRKPLVASNHGLYWTGDFQWHRVYWEYNAAVIEALRRANEILVPSEWVAHPIRRDMRKPPHVIPHGIDPQDFEPQAGNDGYVLWAKPRQDIVSDPAPMNELALKCPKVGFVSTYGRPMPNVTIIGPMPYDQFQEVMGRAAVWLATTRETGDIASREAMARGIPVLGFRWGATAELVRHMETGYLVEPGDYDGLVAGLRYCLHHRARLGGAAREDVCARFDWAELMGRYAEVYRLALEGDRYPFEVSVVVPAYNYAHFLDECLDSVYATDFARRWPGKLEVIVVDDASTDDTQAVLARRRDPNLRVLRRTQNGGLSAALNTGHAAARGRYVGNLDADNLLTPGGLSLLYDALQRDRALDVAAGNLAYYQENGQHVPAHDWPFGRVDVHQQLDHYNQVASTCLMRARSVRRLGGYRVRQRKNEDGEFWCRAMSAGLRVEQVTDEPVFVYRWHGDNKSKVEGGEDDPEGPLSWNFYYPWRRWRHITPFAMLGDPPNASWEVHSYERPHVSVVIPVGPGHEHYLVDALDSVYGQTYRQFEVVVANDTGEPLDTAAMGHPWVRVVEVPGGRGPAAARNAAIAAARAPLIVPLDADDMLYPGTLSLFYRAWLLEQESLVYADCDTEDLPGRRQHYPSGPWSWDRIRKQAVYQVTTLFAKQWWEAVGGYDEDVEWEDWVFGLKLHFAGIGATYVQKPWGVYRHWTHLAGEGSKSDRDNADYGTPEFRARLERVYAYIAQKEGEIEMACRGCGKKAKAQTFGGVGAPTGAARRGGNGKMIVQYTGGREGHFSINSKAIRGKKYRVSRFRPFEVEPGDEWIGTVKDFEEVAPEPPAAMIGAEPIPVAGPRPPTIEVVTGEPPRRPKLSRPPPPPELPRPSEPEPEPEPPQEVVEMTPVSTLARELGSAVVNLLQGAGFVNVEYVRRDLLRNRGRGILDVKGIGASRLADIRKVVLGGG